MKIFWGAYKNYCTEYTQATHESEICAHTKADTGLEQARVLNRWLQSNLTT